MLSKKRGGAEGCGPPGQKFLYRQTMKGEVGMHRQRNFLLVVTLAALAMTPAAGQGVSPANVAVNSEARSTISIPDLSGAWSLPSLNALEPPLSGPGPVRNRSRVRAGRQAGVSSINQLVGDYTNPILQ